jgi:uncharacterized lipoprotein
MSRRGVRRISAVASVLLALVLAGCGVTTQERPARIGRDDVPFGLLRNPPSTEPSTTTSTTSPVP